MKKLVFMFVAIAAITMASCGDSTSNTASNDTTVVDTVDSVNADSIK